MHRSRRQVRLADVRPSGRMRLDSVARYLQDIAADDVRQAGLRDEVAWVVRRTAIEVRRWPHYDDVVELATWCSGTGAAWAERRTSLRCGGEAVVETAAIWVSLDPVTMRPVTPSPRFLEAYGAAAAGRRVRTKLSLPLPEPSTAGSPRTWPLRSADLDLLGHVNNAVAWVAVEDEMTRVAPGAEVLGAEVEYRTAIEWTSELTVRSEVRPGTVLVWLGAAGEPPMISARVRIADPANPTPSPPGA